MSHIDEGELTAYADGAYAPSDAEAQRIAAHLSMCANCRNRLAEAQALSGRAGEILAFAAPAAEEMPAFADVTALAHVAHKRSAVIPLAWAATVILALGLGWLARGALQQPVPQVAATRNAVPAAPQTATPDAPAPAPAARPARDSMRILAAASPVSGGRTARTQRAVGAARAAESSAQAAVAERAEVSTAGDVVAAAAPPPSAPAPDYFTAADAERRGLAFHFIPELEVLRVATEGEKTIVEQKLPGGAVLTLTMLRQNAVAAAELRADVNRKAAAQMRSVNLPQPSFSITRGNTVIYLNAPVSADSLKTLAEKVR